MQKSCYVSRPFGKRSGGLDQTITIDFDRISSSAIRPAVEGAGLRCVEGLDFPPGTLIQRATFEAILECDLFIADLTFNNPNVLYELGLRHGVRSEATFLIQARNTSPLPYHLKDLLVIPYRLNSEATLSPGDPETDELQNHLLAAIRSRLSGGIDSPIHVAFPERFSQYPLKHMHKMAAFHAKGSFDDSVFIMTKFPDGNMPFGRGLQKVIDVVRDSIRSAGFVPRIASERPWYHPSLWDNVEIHLIGCQRGIAIVEGKSNEYFNPNVAIEWGWMKGMGKDILFLLEKDFAHRPADWQGLLYEQFSWEDPDAVIGPAVRRWLSV